MIEYLHKRRIFRKELLEIFLLMSKINIMKNFKIHIYYYLKLLLMLVLLGFFTALKLYVEKFTGVIPIYIKLDERAIWESLTYSVLILSGGGYGLLKAI
jgi:hypothetical protein